ncbi:MAG: hypothetical protein IBX57_08890 [Gammaproteobacteria bacterium]|nr:hypothetical protein [Gammaproteobacteria bacterium]
MRQYKRSGKVTTERQQSSLCFVKRDSGAAKMTIINDKTTKNDIVNFWSYAIQNYSDYLIRY